MKFALPDDFPLYSPEQIISSVSTDSRIMKIAKFEEPKTKSDSRQNNEVHDMFMAITKYTNDWINSKSLELLENQLMISESIKYAQDVSESNVLLLNDIFSEKLNLQTYEVNQLIEAENRRIRLEEEARRRRLEEEQRLKRLEEERIRKEEQIRKENELKRIEAERVRREQERLRQEEEKRIQAEKERLEAEKLKREAELKAAKEAELKAKQEAEIAKQKELKEKESQGQVTTNFANVEKEFLKYKNDIADIKAKVVEPINSNKEIKRQVNQFKRQINPKFGQLSHSILHTNSISQEICHIIEQIRPYEPVYKWILNFIAKAIVDQAETEVIVRPFAARPLALLSYFILDKFPDFEYYLTARFIKKCPYIIGYTCAIDSEEGRLRMGYKRNEDGKWEDDVKYDERVSGICTVWAVMTHARDSKQSVGIFSQIGSWQFIARLLNTNLQLIKNTHFELIANWWEATGVEFLKYYGQQGNKIAILMFIQLVGAVSNRRYPSAARLHLIGEEWIKKGKIQRLKLMER
ncbi:uncharacterized protein KGF55_000757 [Candida pseudojiufengensis]|uniref:uncharacterized protein n=1 Tax=Candida pseudojiufengensis TaxID=497109 RepID=UPI00222595E0|nr:uncharacterized protein KGF55_000757 [Candida pseudojiufengensis]KAI5966448.1 hypothetical protein KGF55_000757 [Candida pseudojiufengensis]